MSVEVSVVAAMDPTRSPQSFITSLDEQTLLAEHFELVFLDPGLADDERRSLDRLASRRPNVRVLAVDENWRSQLSGKYVLEADVEQRFFPESLQRLVAFGDANSLEVVAGRLVRPGHPLMSTFLLDDPELTGEAVQNALINPLRLVRVDRFRSGGDSPQAGEALGRTGVLASYPAAYTPAGTPDLALPLRLERPSVRWQGDDIVIEASGTVTAEDSQGLTPVLLARQLETFLTYALPSEGAVAATPENDGGAYRWSLATAFSPLTALAGEPLPRGQWQFDVVVSSAERASAPVRLPGASVQVGILDGLIVVAADEPGNALHLDLGPTRRPVISNASAEEATVTESARGCLLRLRLPDVHVRTVKPVSGHIALDRLTLPATIETATGTAELTAFVSGLPGTYALSAQFGGSRMAPTGLSLLVSPAGQMEVIPTPSTAQPAKTAAAPSAPKAALPAKAAKTAKKATTAKGAKTARAAKTSAAAKKAKRARAAKKTRAQPATGLVAQLRRAAPDSIEPLIRKLRRQPVARAVYQRLTGLGNSGGSGSRRA